ncbi:MAG: hypothetical protein HYX25_10355 [Candidatus Solibacter usitatus]|nr:hypothetical protein [Candidatus Solibacter usitatus]
MTSRKWALIVIVNCAVVAEGVVWYMAARRAHPAAVTPASLIARLPVEDAAVLYVDFDALRRGGVLQLTNRSKVIEEPDYQAFVASTGFDYKSDLDAAAAAFRPDGDFFTVRGRFDWKKLQAYAQSQGGSCYNDLCRLTGSTPTRQISFLRLEEGVMALAVSPDAMAATRIAAKAGPRPTQDLPSQPVWLSLPSAALRKLDGLPGGTRVLAKAMEDSESILLSAGPQGKQFEARVEVMCRNDQDAAALGSQLERITALLRDSIAREKRQPDPNDLSGVLTGGVFEHTGRRVLGRWPIASGFLETLAGGGS